MRDIHFHAQLTQTSLLTKHRPRINRTPVQRYVKNGSRLYNSNSLDVLGNIFNITSVGTTPKVNDTTYVSLSDIAPADFWSPFH